MINKKIIKISVAASLLAINGYAVSLPIVDTGVNKTLQSQYVSTYNDAIKNNDSAAINAAKNIKSNNNTPTQTPKVVLVGNIITCPDATPGSTEKDDSGNSYYIASNSIDIIATPNICTTHLTELNNAFANSNFNRDLSNLDTSNITSMVGTFENNLTYDQDISMWDVSNVIDHTNFATNSIINGTPKSPFAANSTISLNANGVTIECPTSKIKTIEPFNGQNYYIASNTTDILSKINSGWNSNYICTTQVTDMYNLFSGSTFNGDISSWDTSNVTRMNSTFENSSFNGDISKWNVSNVEYMSNMFQNSSFQGDLSQWDVSNVKYMNGMFYGYQYNNTSISNWNTASLVTLSSTFTYSNMNIALNWDTSKVTSLSYTFVGSSFNDPSISNWNTSNVTNMSNTFRNATSFNQNIHNWNTTKVTDHGLFATNTPIANDSNKLPIFAY